MDDYTSAADMFRQCAENCVMSNLKRFNSKMFLLKSILCKYATSTDAHKEKYTRMIQTSTEFEEIDYLWSTCKERLFVTKIAGACLNGDLDAFADHIYYWYCVRPPDILCIKVLQKMKDDIISELARKRESEERERVEEEERKRKQELKERMNDELFELESVQEHSNAQESNSTRKSLT